MPDQAARVEKVKLRNIVPNRFKKIPLEEDAVNQLVAQFRARGFHNHIVARKRKDGKYEIAFGHHRTEALRQVHGEDHEIEVEIANLTDRDMIEEMAGDNDFSYNYTMKKLDNDVRAYRDYLLEHPEEQREALTSEDQEDNPERVRLGAPRIAKALKKKLSQVQLSMERLNAIENGVVNPEALYLMPNAHTADIFINILKRNSRLDKKYHLPLAKIINRDKAYNENAMEMCIYIGGLGFFAEETYNHDYGWNLRFKRLSGIMHQLNLSLYYLPSEIGNFFEGKRNITDTVRTKDLKDFHENTIALKYRLEGLQKLIESSIPSEVWTDEEPKPTTKQYKALLARTERKQGKNVILHPGQLRKDFGLHKKKDVPWGRYRLSKVKQMIKEGKFYY